MSRFMLLAELDTHEKIVFHSIKIVIGININIIISILQSPM